MKRASVVLALAIVSVTAWRALPTFAQSQTQPYRVVFDLTSGDVLDHKAVLRWITEISAANPKAEAIEVVMFGKGFEMVTQGRTTVADEVAQALKDRRVAFAVCQMSMRNNNITASQLLPGVTTVPDGIYEIFSKQRAGWGYVKVGH